jgi:genome maintenance exonuclease 1
MEFKHCSVSVPELTTKNINRKRFYQTPEGKLYPSITTVLQKQKMQGLMEWRKRVGDDVANYIARTAANRGTKVHHMCEDFLNNKFDEETHKKNFLPYMLFGQIKPILMQKVNNIFAQECGLYTDKYKVAGRVDCIAEYKNTPSIIDFKTSTKERNDDWNESYYIQASAYAEMFEERTGIEINQIVILVVTEDGIVQEFVKDKSEYLEKLIDAVDDFTTDWERENEVVHSDSDAISA